MRSPSRVPVPFVVRVLLHIGVPLVMCGGVCGVRRVHERN